MKENQFCKTIYLIVLTVALLILSADAAEKIQYKLNLKKGQSYYMRLISDSNVAQEMAGQKNLSEISTGFGYLFDVNEVDENGNALVDCTVDWVKLNHKSSMTEFSYDSAKQASPVPRGAESTAMFLGVSFSLKISPQGRVEEFGFEKLRKNLEKKILEGPERQQMLQFLEQKNMANTLEEQYLDHLAVFPDKPVGIGESWTQTKYMKSQPFIKDSKWTLKARKAGIATIEESTTIKHNPNAEQNREIEMKIEMSGTSTGLIEMEESTGRIIRRKTTGDFSGQIQAGTTNILMQTKGTTTFEMTERKSKAGS